MSPVLWINKACLIQNFNQIKAKTSSPFICPMVKANAYGVGDTAVVGALLSVGAQHFGVARTFEGEKLRRFFPSAKFDILVFNALSADTIFSYLESGLTPVISSFSDLKVLKALSSEHLRAFKKVHLKFDLGMSRFGFRLSNANEVFEEIRNLGLNLEGVCGHFPDSENFNESNSSSRKNLKNLVECAKALGLSQDRVHAPNTAAISRGKSFDVGLRPGLGLYGFDNMVLPESSVSQSASMLSGVLKLTAPILGINEVLPGEEVSYGGGWKAEKNTKIGILPIGYADGLRRGLSNRIRFVHNKYAYEQVGVICMDYCMVDLKTAEGVHTGDEMVLFDQNNVDVLNWSKLLKTIPYEIITALGDRIERRVF